MTRQRNPMSKKDFEDYFKTEVIPVIVERYEQDGVPDRPARREEWNNHVDFWIQEGLLPEKAGDWSHPRWLETYRPRGGRSRNPAMQLQVSAPGKETVAVVLDTSGQIVAPMGKYPVVPIEVSAKQYREVQKWEKNPSFSLSEPTRAAIGAAVAGALGAISGPWVAGVMAAVGSLVGSNWRKIVAGTKAGSGAYRATARANNPSTVPPGELVGRLKF